MPAIRPRHLSPGDRVAVLSPSWGGPATFPHVFDHGLAELDLDARTLRLIEPWLA